MGDNRDVVGWSVSEGGAVPVAVAVAATEPATPESPEQLDDEELLAELSPRRRSRRARGSSCCASCRSRASSRSRYRHAGEPLEDLVQVACVGLLKAIDRYEPARGAGFARYAVPTMLGEIKRHFRDKGWSVRVPRATQELALKVSDALSTLPARLGRAARPRDVAEAIGASVEEVLEAMEAATAYEAASLDAPRAGAGEDEQWTYGDSLADEEQGLRARRDRRDAARHPRRAAAARAPDPEAALRARPHPGRDRRVRSACRRCTSRACCAARSTASRSRARPRRKKWADRRRPTSPEVRWPAPAALIRGATRGPAPRNAAARPAAARRACAPARRPRRSGGRPGAKRDGRPSPAGS